MAGKKYDLTRKHVAARLGISSMHVMRLAKAGAFSYQNKPDPWSKVSRYRFCEEEIAAFALVFEKRRRAARIYRMKQLTIQDPVDGKIAANVFRLLSEAIAMGKNERQTLREIVIATELSPSVVRFLYEEWSLGFHEKKKAIEREKGEFYEYKAQNRHENVRESQEYRTWKLKMAEIELKKAEIEREARVAAEIAEKKKRAAERAEGQIPIPIVSVLSDEKGKAVKAS